MLTFVIVGIFCAAGRLIFEMFGITLPAFRITGGLLVFLIGFHMVQGELSSVHNPTDEDKDKSREAELDVAISPLTMPILAGPDTIATAMNFTAAGDAFQFSTTMGAFFLLCVVTYLFFVFGGRSVQYVGQSAINAVTRLMGLILAVVGTQMVIDGVRGVIPSLHS